MRVLGRDRVISWFSGVGLGRRGVTKFIGLVQWTVCHGDLEAS